MTRKQTGVVFGAIVLAVIAPLLVLALLHGAGGTAQANGPLPDPFSKVSMPDFGQHSKSWCWVGAASNSFWWFANTGDYPELMDPGDEFIEPLSRDATPGAPDNYDPHDFDKDGVTNEPDGVPDWFDYNDRPENTGPVYDGTCGDYVDNDGDAPPGPGGIDFSGVIFQPGPVPPPGPLPPDPDCTSPWWGGASPQGDDDSDGSVDEDPINGGVDEDGDSTVDEDPIDIPPFDDDLDGLFDEDPPAYDDDGDGPADEDGVVGYRTLLKEVAQTVWRDTNQNGIRDPGERSYVYSEAVEKWDYLIGLQAYIDDHGAALQVHDLLHPNFTGNGITAPTDENRGAMSWSRPSQLTAQAAANSGVSQVVRIPTLDDYKTELSRSQDVLVWMCRKNAQFDWYCHVVTGQGYDTTVGGAHGNGIITVSDPWTHASVHDDGWLNQGGGPDHNNDYKHPDPEPYDDCDVFTPGSNAPAQDFVIDCGPTRWTVVDLIFISPEGPDVKILDWGAPTTPSPILMDVLWPETILVSEVKHNNGPGGTIDASATWRAEVSDPALLSVRWMAQPGDTCTLNGTPVPCQEDGSPFGPDNCWDGVDNDGDGGCDTLPGSCLPPEPPAPDPECLYAVNDLEFGVTLDESTSLLVERDLGLLALDYGNYSVTLINEEWPMGGYDRDPSNNVATTTLYVNVPPTAGSVDKGVLDIIFDDALSYPAEGADIGNDLYILKSENTAFSVTSQDVNYGPDEPTDAEISFYVDVPAGCSGRWYDPSGYFPYDIQTIGGDENFGSSGTPWFPPAKEAGPVRLDLHFQTAEYGYDEPVGPARRYTRFFEIHCYDAPVDPYVFTFCNRADPKFDTDPDPLNNLLCEDLYVWSLHNADIKVLDFYSDPDPLPPFDVSTYNVIQMIENKHNNGPQDALSGVIWWMDPIEDRDGDGLPDINVRWEALVGDICTYQGGVVPCGEGDGPGTGGSGDGNPSLTGDNCQDDFDNDGDGTCDINGCTAYPGMGDADCQVDIDDLGFYVPLPVSADAQVQRGLKLHCKIGGNYTLSLSNYEWPVDPENPEEPWEDPDPDSNLVQMDLPVICAEEPHYKGYFIYDGTGFVGEAVTLQDQFNPVPATAVVQYPYVLAPPAVKYVDGDYAGGDHAQTHLKCYTITGLPPADATVNLTHQFGTETGVDVGDAVVLCVPALKAIYPDVPTGIVPLEPHYVCYNTPPGTPPPGLTIDLETQFGLETDVQFSSTFVGTLCAPALKNGDGDLDAPHLRCWTIDQGANPLEAVNLETQFGSETNVDVEAAWWMCVPAVKEVLQADVKILGQRILAENCIDDPPADIVVSQDTVICVEKTLHNNGPYGPVAVDIDKVATAEPGCWIDPLGPPEQVLLENSVTLVHTEQYLIHCDEASSHAFWVDNDITIKDQVITDPNPTNNSWSTPLTLNAWADADVKIVDQQILDGNCLGPAPTEIPLSVDVEICVLKLLHNNGPYTAQPVQVEIAKTAWASPGAEILPASDSAQVDLYFSDAVPHIELFTIHCYEPSTHTFTVDNDVIVKDAHVTDPNGASASSFIDVNCTASSDIKITSSAFLNWPSQITVGVPQVVTLRKELHNNGLYGPAMVDIVKTAYTNSPNATITPPSAIAQVDLAVSATVIHDEDFTISCSAPGFYTYTVDNDVISKEPHISGSAFASRQLIDVECVETPQEADLEKVDLYVKPFYCGDSDMDGLEDLGAPGGALPGFGNCCDGVDNDADTLTDGQDDDCFADGLPGPNPTFINEDAVDGLDDDGDTFVDEDPPSYPADYPAGPKQTCPWNGDDDCDGQIPLGNPWCDMIYNPLGIYFGDPQYCVDEDPKNGIDDDGDCPPPNTGGPCDEPFAQGGCMEYCDEDPANGFLGIDNDADGYVDEDGAGSFDWDGDTMVDERQLEGVDDDGDTQVDEDPLDSPVGEPGIAHEPHYLIKEVLRNNTPDTIALAEDTKEIDAPAWRANAKEDGLNTCNDGLDNETPPDGLIDAEDPDCLAVHVWEEEIGLHSCNDGLDNGGSGPCDDGVDNDFDGDCDALPDQCYPESTPDADCGGDPGGTEGDGADEADPDCATLTEVSVECEDDLDVITVKPDVPWYIKPPSWDPVLTAYPGCEQYYDDLHQNKCVPCKIPADFFYLAWGQPMPDVVAGAYCMDLVLPFSPPMMPGYCIAVDSVPGVIKELDLHQEVEIPWGEDVLREHQFDLSCEGNTSLHKFIIQNEIQPVGVEDPIPDNNQMEMEMLVACVAFVDPEVLNLTVPASPWTVNVSTSAIQTVSVEAYNNGPPANFTLALVEESPGLGIGPGPNQLADRDGDTWADNVEVTLISNPEDPFSMPEHIYVPGTCTDGVDNDNWLSPNTDLADAKCRDTDEDGDPDVIEAILHSNPADRTSSPEHMAMPWTCDDKLDNDGDGRCDQLPDYCWPGSEPELDDDGDFFPDCSDGQLQGVRPPVTCASGWAREDANADTRPDGTDIGFIRLAGDGTLRVGVKVPLNNWGVGGSGGTVSRDLVLHCFAPASPYPTETVQAYIWAKDRHMLDLNAENNFDEDTFSGDAICGELANLELVSWDFGDDVPPDFHVSETHWFNTTKTIHNYGPTQADVRLRKSMNVPVDCDGSLHVSYAGETVTIAEDTMYKVDDGPWTPGPAVLNPSISQTVYVQGSALLDPGDSELAANFILPAASVPVSVPVTVDEDFDIHCYVPGTHAFEFGNQVTLADYPDICDPDLTNISADVTKTVEVLPAADIKVLEFEATPRGLEATVSVWTDPIDVRELKHNNGPMSTVADVDWWVTGGYPTSPVNVRWVADPLDDCTYQGNPVDCILGNPDPGPDQGDIDDLHFQVDLPVSPTVELTRQISFHCKEVGTYVLTLWNEEQSKDPTYVDPVPSNNTMYTNVTVHCDTLGEEVDKMVEGIEIDKEASDRDSVPPDSVLDIWVSENVPITVTSYDINMSMMPTDSLITFLADVPLGCEGRWLIGDPLTDWIHDMEQFDPMWPLTQIHGLPHGGAKVRGDGDTSTAESALHFQAWEEPMMPNAYSRDFELHCFDDGTYTFNFCNKAEVKEPNFDSYLDNNWACTTLDVTAVNCDSGIDSDGDTFDDDVECYLPTDQADACPDDPSDDAWPLDNNADTYVTVVPDILAYRGRVNTTGGPPADPMWMQRLDLNADNFITVVPDILYYRGMVNTGC